MQFVYAVMVLVVTQTRHVAVRPFPGWRTNVSGSKRDEAVPSMLY